MSDKQPLSLEDEMQLREMLYAQLNPVMVALLALFPPGTSAAITLRLEPGPDSWVHLTLTSSPAVVPAIRECIVELDREAAALAAENRRG